MRCCTVPVRASAVAALAAATIAASSTSSPGVTPGWPSAHQGAGARSQDGARALLAGQVTVDGAPAGAAKVTVSLFPVFPENGFKPGTPVDTLDLAPAATGADGAYTVPAPTAAALRGYVDGWGRINATVVVDDGTHVTSHTESTDVAADVTTGVARSRYAHRAPARAATYSVDLGTGAVEETMGLPGSATTAATVARTADFAAAQDDLARRHPCTKTFGKKHYEKPERFMYVNNWVGATASVTQGSGTSHQLGIGWKLDGKAWSAAADYSTTVSTANHAVRHNVVDRWVMNKMNTQDVIYRGLCEYPGQRTERRAYSVHTLISGVRKRPFLPEIDSPAGCQKRGRNYGYTKNSTSNMTVSGGLDMSTVKVSALSGWSSDTSFTIDVDKATKECWSNEDGPEHSRYVHYRAWKRTEPCGRVSSELVDPSRCRAARSTPAHR